MLPTRKPEEAEYKSADGTTKIVLAQEIRVAEERHVDLEKNVREATLRQPLSGTGLETLATTTAPENGLLPVANEIVSNGMLKEHDGGRTIEGALKSGEPIFITKSGGEPVLYLTEDGLPNGQSIQVERTDPPAVGVNTTQTAVIWRRVAKEIQMQKHRNVNIDALAPVIVRATGVGPDPSLFMDKNNAEDIQASARMFLGLDIHAYGFFLENGALDSLAFGTLFQWLRKEAGGRSLDTMRRIITPDDIRTWKEIYDGIGINAENVSLKEVRERNRA